jgi:hypothetical protein
MSLTDQIAAAGAIFTGVAALFALFTFFYTWHRYRHDQRQQRAAQTREVLQAIIADCNRFLRPLTEEYPYPILHTATDISKEFCSRMGEHPEGKDVRELLRNEKLLRSICVEGWINSTQIFRMLTIAEEVERKASSHYLRGKLLLICDASFFLAELVAQICSPDSFFVMLDGVHEDLEQQIGMKEDVEDALNTITITLQDRICIEFERKYRKTIESSLYFIQSAANVFISLSDTCLLDLAKADEEHAPVSSQIDAVNGSKQVDDHLKGVEHQLDALAPAHMEKQGVKHQLPAVWLGHRGTGITPEDYSALCTLMAQIKSALNPGCKTSPIEETTAG